MLACHFYGNLTREEGLRFTREAGRIGRELVVIEAALREEREAEESYWRALAEGAQNRSSGRRFGAAELALEIGGSVLFEGRWFVAAVGRRGRSAGGMSGRAAPRSPGGRSRRASAASGGRSTGLNMDY